MLCALDVLGCLISIASCNTRIAIVKNQNYNYGLLIYNSGSNRVVFLKLLINKIIIDNFQSISYENAPDNKFESFLLTIFRLPFNLLDLICTDENIFVIGEKHVVDIKRHIESFFGREKERNVNDDLYEFTNKTLECPLKANTTVVNFHNKFFIGCNFLNNSFYTYENLHNSTWELHQVYVDGESKVSNINCVSVTDLVDFDKDGRKNSLVFTFLHSKQATVIKKMFDINCDSSENICLVCKPSGKIQILAMSGSSRQSAEIDILYDLKEPVVGINFIENIGKTPDSAFLIIIATSGMITLFSSKKFFNSSLVPGKSNCWILTTYLKSAVLNYCLIDECLIHICQDRKLWITNIENIVTSNSSVNEVSLFSNSTELSEISEIFPVDKILKLVLLISVSGSIYIAVCKTEVASGCPSSLPILMNECLQQSNSMEKLSYIKILQNRLFSSISSFASIKFNKNLKEKPIVSLVHFTEFKKIVLSVDCKCLKNLNLDPELCYIHIAVNTYFQRDFTLISKTVPINLETFSLTLELKNIHPSLFPLLVQIGLILQIPEQWKELNSFQLLSKYFPHYIQIQTSLIHELHLYQSSFQQTPLLCDHPIVPTLIKQLNERRPVCSLLKAPPSASFEFLQEFKFYMPISTFEGMQKSSVDSDSYKFIVDIFQQKYNTACESKNSALFSNLPLSIKKLSEDVILILLTANSFSSLVDFRMAILQFLMDYQNNIFLESSAYISIPASIYTKCEEVFRDLTSLHGKDLALTETTLDLINLYEALRTSISEKLPIL